MTLGVGPLTSRGFQDLTNVSRETMMRLETYANLLKKWQRAINLVSNRTLDDLWRRHMLDSAQIWPFLAEGLDKKPGPIIDLGTGAGFPGMVLAIMGAGDIHLMDSDSRKCAFLREVARETGTSVTIHQGRFDEIVPFEAKIVVSRACAPLDVLLRYAGPYLGPETTCLFLKGEQINTELTTAKKHWRIRETLIPSVSDSRGVVLKLEGISHGTAG